MIGARIKELLEEKGLNKAEFARKIGMSPQSLNGLFKRESIETKNLDKICQAMEVPISVFFGAQPDFATKVKVKTEFIQVFMNNAKEGVIPILNQKAAAGYPAHLNDKNFLADLPHIKHPAFSDGNYLCVQVAGDSMEPTLTNEDYIIGKYVDSLASLRDHRLYVVVNEEGVVVKRMVRKPENPDAFVLHSDNKVYDPFEMHSKEILQAWEVKVRMTTKLDRPDMFLYEQIGNLANEIAMIKGKIGSNA